MKNTTMSVNEALYKYSNGEIGLEKVNEILVTNDLQPLVPDQNVITPEEYVMTKVGEKPSDANGFGLIDMGIPVLQKVKVVNGKIDHKVNEVDENGNVNMDVDIYIGGKKYHLRGDVLVDKE